MNNRCPGMDPAYFKPEDIHMQLCTNCSNEIEFWKDDIFLVCSHCRTRNTNARVQNTCLTWCAEASACVGNMDINEWLHLQRTKRQADKQ